MGMHVTMFFTFWGLNVIQKNDAPVSGKGIMRKMLNWMNRGGSKRLKLSKFHMLGLGTSMMGTLMRDVKIPSIEEFIKMAEDMGIEMIACTTSIGVMGLEENAFRAETSDLAGAAYFLGEARKSSVTLFI